MLSRLWRGRRPDLLCALALAPTVAGGAWFPGRHDAEVCRFQPARWRMGAALPEWAGRGPGAVAGGRGWRADMRKPRPAGDQAARRFSGCSARCRAASGHPYRRDPQRQWPGAPPAARV